MIASDAMRKIDGVYRLHRHLQLELVMNRVNDPLRRAFADERRQDLALDWIAHQIAAERAAKRRQLREWLASPRLAEEV